jgi:hypothetical protein
MRGKLTTKRVPSPAQSTVDRAAVLTDNSVGDREAQARALCPHGEERIEDPFTVLRRNARPGIFDHELDAVSRVGGGTNLAAGFATGPGRTDL